MVNLLYKVVRVLKKTLDPKPNEKILIVTDQTLIELAQLFFDSASKLSKKVLVVQIPISKNHGVEPPKDVAKLMKEQDVVIMITTKSLSHTKARINATKSGVRVVSMPGLTKDMVKRLDLNYERLKRRNELLIKILTKGSKVNVNTKNGTNIEMDIKDCKWFNDDGNYKSRGAFGNLPAGEVCVMPRNCNGVLVVDGSIADFGKVKKVIIKVKDKKILDIKGIYKKDFINLLKRYGNDVKNIAEFGIGTNDKALISGNTLEDEKVLGTIHVAFGNDCSFGGNVRIPLHIDCVIRNPEIIVDKKIRINDYLI